MRKTKSIISLIFLFSIIFSQNDSKDYNGWPKEELEKGFQECVNAPEMDEEKCECLMYNLPAIIGYQDYKSLNERIESNMFTEEDIGVSMEIAAVMTNCLYGDYSNQVLSKDKQWTVEQKNDAIKSCKKDMFSGAEDPSLALESCECFIFEISAKIDYVSYSAMQEREPTDSEEDKKIQGIVVNAVLQCMKGMF